MRLVKYFLKKVAKIRKILQKVFGIDLPVGFVSIARVLFTNLKSRNEKFLKIEQCMWGGLSFYDKAILEYLKTQIF